MIDLSAIKNILIIRLSSLGDVLLTTPVVRSLKRQFPDIKIDFLTKEQYAGVYEYNPYISNVFIFNQNNKYPVRKLINEKYDLIIDLQNNLRSKKICAQIRTKKVSFQKPDLEKFLLVKFKINTFKKIISIPERYSKCIPGLKLDNNGLDLFIPEKIKPQLHSGKSYIGFCPGSRHFSKMWPGKYFIELGNSLLNKNFIPVLFGGTSDKHVCEEIHNSLPNSINLCNDNNLLQTARDMQDCRTVICNDSGLMHAATAVNVPVVAIFGSTVREFGFAPYHTKNLILENNSLSCRPCSHIGLDKCPKGHFKCMVEITPEIVFNETLKFIDVNE